MGGICAHVINRGNGKRRVFHDERDYRTFLQLAEAAAERIPMRVLSICLMPNHFHMVLWPREDGDLSAWMHWLCTVHAGKYHHRHETSGRIWEGRFKAFPIEEDHHLLTVIRYVERNPLRANLVSRAEDWLWSSVVRSSHPKRFPFLNDPPIALPGDWLSWVNQPQTEAELEAIRWSVKRGQPFGSRDWIQRVAVDLGLEFTLRATGRPRKAVSRERPALPFWE